MQPTPSEATHAHIARTGQISSWLARAGASDPDARATLAVGLADVFAAARSAEAALDAMLALDPTDPVAAREALRHSATVYVQLFNELRWHLDDMAPVWEEGYENHLAERAGPDPDEESDSESAAG